MIYKFKHGKRTQIEMIYFYIDFLIDLFSPRDKNISYSAITCIQHVTYRFPPTPFRDKVCQ